MKPYIVSLLTGILVGIIYSLLGVHSPAPPVVALIGLFGMLGGEQIMPVARKMLSGNAFRIAWRESKCSQHMFGSLPGRNAQRGVQDTVPLSGNASSNKGAS